MASIICIVSIVHPSISPSLHLTIPPHTLFCILHSSFSISQFPSSSRCQIHPRDLSPPTAVLERAVEVSTRALPQPSSGRLYQDLRILNLTFATLPRICLEDRSLGKWVRLLGPRRKVLYFICLLANHAPLSFLHVLLYTSLEH